MSVVRFDIKRSEEEDVRNFEAVLKKCENCDYVIHLATLCSVSESFEKPYEYLATNVYGTLNVLEAARINNVKKVIFASSAGIGRKNPYGLSKLIGEELCKLYRRKFNLPVYILRIFNVYGPENKKGVIYEFIKRALKNEPLFINGDGTQERDFVFVSDVVKAIKEILLNDKIKPGIYEIGTGKSTKIIELAKMIKKLTGSNSKIIFRKIDYSEIKISRSKNPFLKKTTPLNKGLKETIEWCKQRL